MLSHYVIYLSVGVLYFVWQSSAASAASEVDGPAAVAMLGSLGLAGVAAPLAILNARGGARAAIPSLVLLCPWIAAISIEILQSPHSSPAFVLATIPPAVYAGFTSFRAMRGSMQAKVHVPQALRYVLAAPLFLVPISMTILIAMRLAGRVAA